MAAHKTLNTDTITTPCHPGPHNPQQAAVLWVMLPSCFMAGRRRPLAAHISLANPYPSHQNTLSLYVLRSFVGVCLSVSRMKDNHESISRTERVDTSSSSTILLRPVYAGSKYTHSHLSCRCRKRGYDANENLLIIN